MTAPHAEQLRVLVVDDNADVADSMATLLRLRGYAVATAYDGPQAIVAARAFPPDVVLLDIGLPGLDGCDVARKLRTIPGLSRVLVIAVTGHIDDEERRRVAEAGIPIFCPKPVNPDAILDFLARYQKAERDGGPMPT